MSGAILRLGQRKKVQITGRPWQKKPAQEVGLNSLVSNVLCEKHNNELSEVDAAGKQFFERLVYVANNLVDPHDELPEITDRENGLALERWFLKYLCGSWAAGDFANGSSYQLPPDPAPELIQAVFGHRFLAAPCGLWIGDPKAFSFRLPFTMEDTVFLDGDSMLGASFLINGLQFILNLTADEEKMTRFLSKDSIFHPSSLMIIGQTQAEVGGMHHIVFDWGNCPTGKHVVIRQTRTC